MANAQANPTFVPPPSLSGRVVLPESQRMAKRARDLVGLGYDEHVSLEPLSVAASMTPDDEGFDYQP